MSAHLMRAKDEEDHGEAFPSERRRRSRQDQNKAESRDFGVEKCGAQGLRLSGEENVSDGTYCDGR